MDEKNDQQGLRETLRLCLQVLALPPHVRAQLVSQAQFTQVIERVHDARLELIRLYGAELSRRLVSSLHDLDARLGFMGTTAVSQEAIQRCAIEALEHFGWEMAGSEELARIAQQLQPPTRPNGGT